MGQALMDIFPRRNTVILPECPVKITAVAVSQHQSNLIDCKICDFQKNDSTLHSLGKQDFRKGFAQFPVQQSGDVVGMVRKPCCNIL